MTPQAAAHKPIFDVPSVAELLGCADKTVRERARRGDLPGIKWGEDWVFPAGALFLRLDEIALEEAHARRQPAKPGAMLHTLPQPQQKRRPPALPAA